MDADLFDTFRKIAYDLAGISLRDGKEPMVSARVGKRMRKLGLAGPGEYLHYLENDETGEEITHFLDVISTNHTNFFREPENLDYLGEEICKLVHIEKQNRIRMWSAASSSGEEPYSMCMAAIDAIQGKSVDFKILATDISTKMLQQAMEGIYLARDLQTVPEKQRQTFFTLLAKRDKLGEKCYKIKEWVKSPLGLN